MAPQNPWSTSKGWAVYFQEMDYSLVESDQHPGCLVSTYFKIQKGTFLLQTFKPFPDGPRGAGLAGVPEPHDAGHRLLVGSGGSWWEASLSAWREMPPMPAPYPFAEHLQEMRQICGKARVCSAEMRPPTPTHPSANCLCWFHFSAAAAHSCLGNGSGLGKQPQGGGGGIGHVFWSWTFLPWQPKQAVSRLLLCTFAVGIKRSASEGDLGRPRVASEKGSLEAVGSRNHIISRLLEGTGGFKAEKENVSFDLMINLVKGEVDLIFPVFFHNKIDMPF